MTNKPLITKIVFHSKPGEVPCAYFHEDTVTIEPDGEITSRPTNTYYEDMSNPEATFDILDWETEQPTGQKMSYAQIQVILWSAYKFIKAKRDAENKLSNNL